MKLAEYAAQFGSKVAHSQSLRSILAARAAYYRKLKHLPYRTCVSLAATGRVPGPCEVELVRRRIDVRVRSHRAICSPVFATVPQMPQEDRGGDTTRRLPSCALGCSTSCKSEGLYPRLQRKPSLITARPQSSEIELKYSENELRLIREIAARLEALAAACMSSVKTIPSGGQWSRRVTILSTPKGVMARPRGEGQQNVGGEVLCSCLLRPATGNPPSDPGQAYKMSRIRQKARSRIVKGVDCVTLDGQTDQGQGLRRASCSSLSQCTNSSRVSNGRRRRSSCRPIKPVQRFVRGMGPSGARRVRIVAEHRHRRHRPAYEKQAGDPGRRLSCDHAGQGRASSRSASRTKSFTPPPEGITIT